VPIRERKKYYRDDLFLKNIGLRIRQIRIQKGMSQENLAFECEYADFSQINRMELGKVNFSISYLKLIAEKLDVPITELLNFENGL
jgi:transcriptional regulator with XRE-family HTH domain